MTKNHPVNRNLYSSELLFIFAKLKMLLLELWTQKCEEACFFWGGGQGPYATDFRKGFRWQKLAYMSTASQVKRAGDYQRKRWFGLNNRGAFLLTGVSKE